MSTSNGIITGINSPVAQFEVRQLAHGVTLGEPGIALPLVCWVDRRPAVAKCPAGLPRFFVQDIGEYVMTPDGPGRAAVCLCSGGFLE